MVIDEMNNAEIMKNAIEDFEKVQRCMILAKEENATKTYAELKRQYIVLKALLSSLGVNLTELDKIKE
jgi:response regulator of citrate/malate metabolism